jgi:hypothetical protein
MAHKPYVFGKKIILDMYTKKGYRVSPGVNDRARAIAKCARGKNLEARKQCFSNPK